MTAAIHGSPGWTEIPSRKTVRGWLIPLSGRSTLWALGLVVLDSSLLALALAGTVVLGPLLLKGLCGLLAGFVIGRLFILGHDACHQSFTPHRSLNRWIGRLVFLPSLTPYSLWEVGHNVVHHGYTNLRHVDFVWAPPTLAEFRALSPWRRCLERIYRSGWAPGLYYLVEVWWRRMYFPRSAELATRRAVFFWDGALVTLAAAGWIATLAWLAMLTGQSALTLVVAGFVIPYLFWVSMIGFVIYVHHTHPAVPWYEDKMAWSQAQAFVTTTVHLTFGRHVGAALHHIMEHTAHHVDMGIPLYRLKRAQRLLEERLPGRIVIQRFSWRWYFDTARRCKLYDFDRHCWTDFGGKATGTPASQHS